MYLEYERVAVVTHVSDEKSIETEDGDGKLKNSSETYLRTQLFFSVSLFFFLILSTERSYLTHTRTLSLLSLHSRGPTESTL